MLKDATSEKYEQELRAFALSLAFFFHQGLTNLFGRLLKIAYHISALFLDGIHPLTDALDLQKNPY